MMHGESIEGATYPDLPFKKWDRDSPPGRVLAIRLQAMGDLVISLPYLQQLKRSLPPGTTLDLLTREEVAGIPRSIELFNQVFAIGGGRNFKRQLLSTLWLIPKLMVQGYQVVIDLQNNNLSRLVCRSLRPAAWSVFDRVSPVPAGECYRLAIERIGLGPCFADGRFNFKKEQESTELLKENGWDGDSPLVVLNPAGAFETRNWPLKNYAEFAGLWLQGFPRTQFLVIGMKNISSRANWLKQKLGERLVDLVDKTTAAQAFSLIQKTKFVLSEDSGLMHMAWVSGIPTLALFGSTKHTRATPLGLHTQLLHSGDLPCGNCMLEFCPYGDTHCLTRYTPTFVFEKAKTLLA